MDITMKYIPLTQGKFAIVDDNMFDYLNQWKWYAIKCRYCFYAARSIGKHPHQKQIRMHRVIMNTPKGMGTDHRNHNGLDNKESNLRICTNAENQHNQTLQNNKKKTSKYKGMSWATKRKRWVVAIKLHNISIHIGYYHNEIEAAKSYDVKAKELFGEFACCNF